MGIFVNQTLNLKSIRAIGFDMDYTIVRYHTKNFEEMAFHNVVKKLIKHRDYPEEVSQLTFDHDRVTRGLVIDKENGNFLKLSHRSNVRNSSHGTRPLNFRTQQRLYRGQFVDIKDESYSPIDTAFALSHTCLFAKLVDFKEDHPDLILPSFDKMERDTYEMLDLCHKDGTLKKEVSKNIGKYIIQDPNVVKTLENFKKHDKVLLLITNSIYSYTKMLMDFAFNPFLENHERWEDLFQVTVTLANKPKFFTEREGFFKIDPETGSQSETLGPITHGLFQGGCASLLQKDLEFKDSEILYIGDHIFGDIVALKKHGGWRTGLIIEELAEEMKNFKASYPITEKIDQLLSEKDQLENEIEKLHDFQILEGQNITIDKFDKFYSQIEEIDMEIAELMSQRKKYFNPHWGEIMRADLEESRFAAQVEKYADIYMSSITDFLDHSARKYFRSFRRSLPHEHTLQ